MWNPGGSPQFPSGYYAGEASRKTQVGSAVDPRVPLLNLSTVHVKMDSLQRFLAESVNQNTPISKDQMDMVSSEIVSALHQIIVNGAALVACSQQPPEVDLTAPVTGNGKHSDRAYRRNQFNRQREDN